MVNLKLVVLLTGTVNPNGMSFTQLQDISVRKAHYIESIKYWMKIPNVYVVFVENSNTDLSDDLNETITNNKFEILTFNGNEYNKSLGKGYGELKCLEYAILNSKFIDKADFIFKVTGRYKVLNFQNFINAYYKNPSINLLIDFKLNLTFSDSRFFGFTKNFIFDYLVQYQSVLDDNQGIIFEHILSKAALNAIADGYIYRPLHTLPRIMGYSASLGIKYNTNYLYWLRHKFKYYLKYKSIGLGHLPNI